MLILSEPFLHTQMGDWPQQKQVCDTMWKHLEFSHTVSPLSRARATEVIVSQSLMKSLLFYLFCFNTNCLSTSQYLLENNQDPLVFLSMI